MEEVQRKGGTREALCEFSAVQDTSSESAWPLNPPVANPARSPFREAGPRTIKGQRAGQAHLVLHALRKRRVLGLGLPSSHLECS